MKFVFKDGSKSEDIGNRVEEVVYIETTEEEWEWIESHFDWSDDDTMDNL